MILFYFCTHFDYAKNKVRLNFQPYQFSLPFFIRFLVDFLYRAISKICSYSEFLICVFLNITTTSHAQNTEKCKFLPTW